MYNDISDFNLESPDKARKFDFLQILEENGNFVQMFGNEGSGVREFRSPGDVATDQADNIYVLDTRNDRVQVSTCSTTKLK